MLNNPMNCETCKFWVEMYGGVGRCHRNPPQVVTTTKRKTEYGTDYIWDEDASHFPETGKSEWCGEYQSKTMIPTIGLR